MNLDPVRIVATLAGHGLWGLTVLLLAFLCLVGLLLGALTLGGNLLRLRRGDTGKHGGEPGGMPAGLASFEWEEAPAHERTPAEEAGTRTPLVSRRSSLP
ncbi:hypothetical protein GCM10009716_48980 [Streptomyces sodiiphilus]|uniref:DUF4229 domain-containing protein n=1 Tax=Streptomyces sodiiphilus TaxID=226217 RepID=A0ABP5B898_9ACTN